jgi:carbonic anhydrase
MNFMTAIDDLVAQNGASIKAHGHRIMPTEPSLQLAVLTCMDSRIDLFGALGLKLGEAHLVRNAGGIASDDAIRSLLLSQWLLGTRSIMVIHHTRCGSLRFALAHSRTWRRTLASRCAHYARVPS